MICPKCGREFQPSHHNQRFCHQPCMPTHVPGTSGTERRRRAGQNSVLEREFVAWDGEGTQHPIDNVPRFVLLQGSNGASIHDEHGLDTETCLRFLTKQPSAAAKGEHRYNNVWFANGYDVNMILCDLEWDRLYELYNYGSTHWGDFYIRYIPRYEFLVQDKTTGYTFDSCDTWGFFQMPFESMLHDWNVAQKYRDIIAEGKAARDEFYQWSIPELKRYNEAELLALVEALESLRSAILASGWSLTRWYGPSSLALWFLRKHNVKDHIAQTPNDHVQNAALTAYFGGRIDAAGWGIWENVYHYDIINAYVHGITKCPSLADVVWTDKPSDDEFSLRHIRWNIRNRVGLWWGPFPWRVPDQSHRGNILYPTKGEGWYWNVEIQAAQEIFGKELQLETVECLTPKHTGHYPLDEPLRDAFRYRYELKKRGDPANKPVKLGYLAISGKFSQTIGYGQKRPAYQCHLWGGFLMAVTRANLLRASGNSGTLMTMTDGMYCRDPIETKWIGDQLGEWEDQGTGRLAVVTAGVYQFNDDIRCKGYLRESMPSFDEIIARFENGEDEILVESRQFIGMGAALVGGSRKSNWRRFVREPKRIPNPDIYGSSKRVGKDGLPEFAIRPRYGFVVKGQWHFQRVRGINPTWEGGGMSLPYTPKGIARHPQAVVNDLLELEDQA